MSAALQPPPPSQTAVTLADPLPPPLSVKISQYFSESIESQRRRHASPEPYGDVVRIAGYRRMWDFVLQFLGVCCFFAGMQISCFCSVSESAVFLPEVGWSYAGAC